MEHPRPPKARLHRTVVTPRIFTESEGADVSVSLEQIGTTSLETSANSTSIRSTCAASNELHAEILHPALGVPKTPADNFKFSMAAPSAEARDFVGQVLSNAAILSEEKEQRIKQALLQVPREPFVYGGDPWRDVQTDTHFGTLSLKPSLVARMLSLLPLKPGDRVLDVSSGVGYTLALLESMGICSFGVEKIPSQAQYSRKLLDKLNLCGAVIRSGEPYRGWSEAAPFDGIVISGPLIKVPRSLFLQLNHDNGFLVCIIVTKRSLRLCLYRRIKGKLSCIRLESL